jgi:hypothetical protein
MGSNGCTAEALVDVIAAWSETISESLAVAEGVNRTRCPSLRLPVGLGNLVPVWVALEVGVAGGAGEGVSATFATGALTKGC